MPNPTCRLLSNGYKFTIDYNTQDLHYHPCCKFTGTAQLVSNQDHRQYRDWLNSIDSKTHPNCANCNYLNNNDIRTTWRDQSFVIVPDDAEIGDPSYVEIQIDRTCNGGCITCGPWHSSYWDYEINKKLIKIQKPDYVNQILSIIDIQKTKKFNFLGGEPFLTDTDIKIIKEITDPSQVDLQYTTNGSIYPGDERISLWKNFKSVLINLSIDGVGEKFEYIRYPLKWNSVTENIQRVRNLSTTVNLKFKINHTVNIFNLYYLDEFIQWYDAEFNTVKFLNNHVVPCTISPASGTLSPLNITPKLYKLLLKKYAPDSKAVKIVTGTNLNASEMLNFINATDSRRLTNWKNVFPEITNCF